MRMGATVRMIENLATIYFMGGGDWVRIAHFERASKISGQIEYTLKYMFNLVRTQILQVLAETI